MTLRELVTEFGFEVDDKPLQDLDKAIDRMKLSLTALGAATIAAAGTLFGFAKVSADYGEDALKSSKKLGMSTEEFTKLSTAAYLADVNTETFTTSLKFLNKALAESQGGNKDMQKTLSKLGVSGAEPAAEAFKKILTNFQKLPNAAVKTKVAMEVFGRSAFDLIPMLNAGNEEMEKQIAIAEKYRLVVGSGQAEAANQFNDALKESLLAIKGVTVAIGNELIPVVMPVIKEFSQFIADNFDAIKDTFVGLAKAGGVFLKIMSKSFNAVWTIIKTIVKGLGGFERLAMIFSTVFGIFLTGALAASIYAIGAALVATAPIWGAMLAAALPIFGIGAAILLIILLLEDLYVSLTGGEGYFADFFKFASTLMDTWWTAFKEKITSVGVLFQTVFGTLPILFNAAIEPLRLMYQLLSQVVSYLAGKGGEALAWASDKLSKVAGLVGFGSSSVTPSAGAKAQIAGGGINQQVENTFNIVPPSSLNTQQASDAVRGGVENGLDRMLRQTNSAFSGGSR